MMLSSGTLDLLQLPIFIISKAFGSNFFNFSNFFNSFNFSNFFNFSNSFNFLKKKPRALHRERGLA